MAVRAFPNCEGYGLDATHARSPSAQILFVDNLNDSGAGSLRAALEDASGPRYVIPRVGGTITLLADIFITNPYVYLAGQVAPGDGLLVRNWAIVLQTHDIVIRFIRARIGNGGVSIPPGRDTNNFLIYAGGPVSKYNIVIDHCDSSWANDQCGPDFYAWGSRTTIQWCAIGEGLITGHSNQAQHNKGCVLGGEPWMGSAPIEAPDEILTLSLHHNWFHSVLDRTPFISMHPLRHDWSSAGNPAMIADVVNNLTYNNPNNLFKISRTFWNETWYNEWVAQTPAGRKALQVNYVSNVNLPGPPNGSGQIGPSLTTPNMWVSGDVQVYEQDTLSHQSPTDPINNLAQAAKLRQRWIGDPISPGIYYPGQWDPIGEGIAVLSPFSCPPVTTTPASGLKALLIGNVGCTKPTKDSVLQRWETEINSGSGAKNNFDHSDYPTLSSGSYPTDSNGDGIPDTWTAANMPPGASALDFAPNDYQYIENYLNEVAGDDVPGSGGSNVAPSFIITQNWSGTAGVDLAINDGTILDEDGDALNFYVKSNKNTTTVRGFPGGSANFTTGP